MLNKLNLVIGSVFWGFIGIQIAIYMPTFGVALCGIIILGCLL